MSQEFINKEVRDEAQNIHIPGTPRLGECAKISRLLQAQMSKMVLQHRMCYCSQSQKEIGTEKAPSSSREVMHPQKHKAGLGQGKLGQSRGGRHLTVLGTEVLSVTISMNQGWGYSSAVEHLPNMCKALGSIPSNPPSNTRT